ncbi:hypothetical protein J3R30DRAFT_3437206 [Lentinula aciculospora]|uniref:Uncharacterized protein n=1 Tax=Lentinula aciculospora TaxID=153920 RepID=A0A9W9A9C4_9AGAR|nr:hypothetical protein J3R30DRAFT_3503023 [Lentinula aciculospora]KAJ4488546.1 hypothetical protein J3R30DRAFT_3437206 [Lentinula aciculospora]
MLAEIVCLISQGLREITSISDLAMSYSKYNKLIVIPYKVRLLGWPEDIPFSYPHKLHAEEIKMLFDSHTSGITHWQRMAAFEHHSSSEAFKIFLNNVDGGVRERWNIP